MEARASEHMPECSHYMTLESSRMPSTTRGDLARSSLISPPESSLPKETSLTFDNDLTRTSSPYESLLLPRIPSPYLYSEEMLELWPTSSAEVHPLRDEDILGSSLSSTSDTRSGSIQSSLDSGKMVPPPISARLVHSEAQKVPVSVERRLLPILRASDNPEGISTIHSPYEPERSETPVLLGQHCSQSEKRNFGIAEPRTSVPSLTHSQCSVYSSALPESPTMITASMGGSALPSYGSLKADVEESTGSKLSQVDAYQWVHDITLPLSQPSIYPDDASDRARFAAFGTAPAAIPLSGPKVEADSSTASHKPTLLATRPEFSYIDCDDDENNGRHSSTRFDRLRRSLADLRAAERFISEASARGRAQLVPGRLNRVKEVNVCKHDNAMRRARLVGLRILANIAPYVIQKRQIRDLLFLPPQHSGAKEHPECKCQQS